MQSSRGHRSFGSSHHRSISVECLERRALLSADLASGVLTVVGSKAGDLIELGTAGSDLSVSLNGEVQLFNAADVQLLHINGGGGNDTITIADDVLIDAWVSGGKGHDSMDGGGGDDVLNGDQGNDVEAGDAGDDEIHGGNGHDSLHGGEGTDELHGENGNDDLSGDEGDDNLDGGTGNDSENGDAGDDEIHGGVGNDSLQGGDGNDELDGESGDDDLSGDEGDDDLDGGTGNDECLGGFDDDVLHGGTGSDHLDGEDGNDLLDGDLGNDDEEDGLPVDLDVELAAVLVSETGASGHAEFVMDPENDGLEVEFDVEVEDAVPGSVLDVLVDGFLVGQIVVDESGHGELDFSSDPDDSDETAFPADFPEIIEGSSASIGGVLHGAFAAEDSELD